MYFCTEGDRVSQISGGRGGLTFESMQDIRPHTLCHDKPLSYRPERLQYLHIREIHSLLDLLERHKSLGELSRLDYDDRVKAFEDRHGRQLLVALHETTG